MTAALVAALAVLALLSVIAAGLLLVDRWVQERKR